MHWVMTCRLHRDKGTALGARSHLSRVRNSVFKRISGLFVAFTSGSRQCPRDRRVRSRRTYGTVTPGEWWPLRARESRRAAGRCPPVHPVQRAVLTPLRRTNWVDIGITFLDDPGGRDWVADAAQIEMRCLLGQIELLETQREQVDEALADLMAQLPQHITTIPGVGAPTGAATQSRGSCTGSWARSATHSPVKGLHWVQRFSAVEKLVAYHDPVHSPRPGAATG